MAYTCVRVLFEIGHVATVRNELSEKGFTHDWELYLRGADNTEIHHFVEKVIFHLHETFPNHRRVVKEPPYVVCETGYAGFPLQIDVYLKNKHEPSKIRFNYHLTLQPKGPPLCNVKKEKYVFKNPSEDFRRKLIKGGGVGVGADSASGHMAALNSDHSTDEHKTLTNNKNKASPQDVSVSSKKSKKENTPKNEEQLSANDPFSIFGQPIKTSKIPLVSKSSSKNQISDKQPPPQEKQSHSSKSSKHSSSSHKDKDKDKERSSGGGGGGGGGGVEKEKTKDKDKNSMKRSREGGGGETSTSSSSKKDKFKDDKVRILKVSSKDDSKKNSYHEDKPPKEKSSSSSLDKSSSAVIIERTSSSGRGSADKELLKFEKKEKEKKHKEEKKSKSKDKYKQNEKKENIDVVMKESSYVNERSEKLFSNKDDYKEEKKFHRIANDDKDNKAEKISSKDKSGAIAETKNLFNNVNNNNNNSSSTNNNTGSTTNSNTDSQIINNGDTQRGRDPEVKHKHHKHKKDKSKKDSKRDKEERSKEKKESKENKERFSAESQQLQQQQQQQQQPQQPPSAPPQPQPPVATATPQSRSTPKSTTASTDSPRRLKKPVKALFELDNTDSELSSMDDDPPPPSLPPAHHRLIPPKDVISSPEMNLIKDEPISAYNKHEEQTKEEKYDTTTAASTKKKKKTNEERENKKRKRKSKDKEENAGNKMIKYDNCPHGTASAAELAGKQVELTGSDRRPPKSVSPSETKFTDEYITKLKELQRKIMTLEDNSGLQRIVQVVAETGQYEITTKTFDFDLCTLDESIVQRLLDFFVP